MPLGAILASTDPVALDLAALRLMGFDPERIPKIREAMRDEGLRITQVREPADVEVVLRAHDGDAPRALSLSDLAPARIFEPHPGWRGHVEQAAES